jgi:Gluconate 2-dehydrogenase subunit 3
MKRRSAIKNLSMALGGLVSLPTWASGWTSQSIGQFSNLATNDEALLAEIVETIIPETNTPGAKSLKVHQFAMRMINDCYGEAAQNTMKQGLVLINEFSQQNCQKSFMESSNPQRMDTFLKMITSSNSVAKQFADMIKRLTIQGYTNSEYYMVHQLKFNMAPGYYHGCVPISL